MKKIFTLFAALMMVLSMSAATKTIYCKMAQSWWKADGAAVGAYYWNPGAAPAWPGVRMTPVAGETDLWSIDIDTDKYTNIIFTRVNGSGTIADWGTKTGDLTIPTDNKNLFTITNTTASWGGGCVGNWSVYAPNAPKTYKDITITVVANATPKIHYWEGGDKMVGTDWDNLPEMTATGEENTYSYTIKDVDEATGVKYLVVVGDVQSANQLASEDVTANFKELLPQVSVMGIPDWTGKKMTVADDYLSASVTLTLEAAKDDYQLKLTVNGEWFGSNAITITKDNNSASFAENGDGNAKLITDLAGDYVFTYTYATKTLVVTYPAPVVKYTVTLEHNTYSYEEILTGAGEYEEGATVTVSAEEELDGAIFVGWANEEGEIVSNDAEYEFVIDGNITLTAIYAEVMELVVNDLEIVEEPVFGLVGTAQTQVGTLSLQLVVDTENEREDGMYNLTEDSQIWLGEETQLEFQEGVVDIDMVAQTATAMVLVAMEESLLLLSVEMSATPAEPLDINITNAEVEATLSEEDGTYELTLTGEWTDEEGLACPVKVFAPVYNPAEDHQALCNVIVGNMMTMEPFIGMGEGVLNITTVGKTVTVSGTMPLNGITPVTINLSISGQLPASVPTDVENNTITVKAAKVIRNGQLIIRQGEVEFNAQGAILK